MKIFPKRSKLFVSSAMISAMVLTLTVVSPAFANIRQGIDTRANCINLQYSKDQELTILTNPDTGIVIVGYVDENGQPKESQLNYKSNDGFAGCSSQAARILSDIKTYQDKYSSDMCLEITEVIDGKRPMPEMDGKRPTIAAAKTYQKQVCGIVGNK